MFERADVALYQAKEAGRNRCVLLGISKNTTKHVVPLSLFAPSDDLCQRDHRFIQIRNLHPKTASPCS